MSIKKNALATVALTGIAVAVSSAYAAGFQLTEQSSLGLGRAYAGAGIVGDDLSAVHYNAAGMTLLPGTQMQAGSVFIEIDGPFNNTQGQQIENGRLKGQAIPAGYITHQVNDQLWLGLGMTVPYGMGTEYNQFWAGADHGNQSMIMTIDINPNIAYKVSEKLSVGAGISLQYAKAELGQAPAEGLDSVVNGDSWAWGWNVGVMYEPSDTMRFGLAYRSNIAHDAEGDMKVSGPAAMALGVAGTYDDFKVRVRTPDTIMATATWEATPDLRLSGMVRWAKWSNLGKLHIQSSGVTNMTSKVAYVQAAQGLMDAMQAGDIPLMNEQELHAAALQAASEHTTDTSTNTYEWEDTWLFSIGADYRLNNEWTIRGGIAYETCAVEDNKLRPATIPDVDRLWLSVGASYNYSKQIQFDFGATYLKGVGNMDVYSADGSRKIGEFDSIDSYILGAQVQYRF